MSSTRRSPLVELGKCPCAGVTLDKLVRPAILTVLADGDLHGYAIVQRIAGMPMSSGQTPDPAGVYRTLRSLSKQGMLTCAWDVSGSGPAKRSYQLTERGRECLATWVRTLEEYRGALGRLLRAARKASRPVGKARLRPCCASRAGAKKEQRARSPARVGPRGKDLG